MNPYDHPPSYPGSSSSRLNPSPQYSATPLQSESIIQSTSSSSSSAYSPSSRDLQYVYCCKNVELNLGPKIWGTSVPAYGSNGVVEGRIRLFGDLKNISSIRVTLKGRATATFTERGLVSAAGSVDLVSSSTDLTPSPCGEWTLEQSLALPFPSLAMGRNTALPPSTITYQPGATCEIKYWLKLTTVRKGFRRNDNMAIPVLYLPRNFARVPSLSFIPEFIENPTIPSFRTDLEYAKIISIETPCKKNPKSPAPVVALALPSVLSFATFDTIPLTLGIISPKAPVLAKLLSAAIRVQLIKRTRISTDGRRSCGTFDFVLGVADIIRSHESCLGVSTMFCELRCRKLQAQQSWRVDGIAEQQYLIRVVVRPPSGTVDHIPSFEYEQPIEMTTDSYDSEERDILLFGSVPSPALNYLTESYMAGSLERVSTIGSARSAYMGVVR